MHFEEHVASVIQHLATATEDTRAQLTSVKISERTRLQRIREHEGILRLGYTHSEPFMIPLIFFMRLTYEVARTATLLGYNILLGSASTVEMTQLLAHSAMLLKRYNDALERELMKSASKDIQAPSPSS